MNGQTMPKLGGIGEEEGHSTGAALHPSGEGLVNRAFVNSHLPEPKENARKEEDVGDEEARAKMCCVNVAEASSCATRDIGAIEAAAVHSMGAALHPSGEGLVNRAFVNSYLPEPLSSSTAHCASTPASFSANPPLGGSMTDKKEHVRKEEVVGDDKERAKSGCVNVAEACASTIDGSSRFICHICLNSPEKPVVTVCGHLHCWGCLYKWLNLHRDDPQCPVCKAGIEMSEGDPSRAKVVPLYVGDETSDPRNSVPEDTTIPQRPPAERPDSQRMGGNFGAFGPGYLLGPGQIVANISLFPSLFGLAFQTPGMHVLGGQGGAQSTEAAARAQAAQAAMLQHEAAQQEFLSRLLFMIGTLIALCLIFFP